MTRRRFLATAGALAAAPYIVPGSVLGAPGRKPANSRVQVAVIGAYNRGKDHLKAMLTNKDVQLVAICDVDAAVLAEGIKFSEAEYAKKAETSSFKGIKGYNDFRELIARKDLDALTICTPDHTHTVIAIAAANAKKDIYLEKPIAHNIFEGRAIVEAVKRNKIILQVGSQRRSNPKFRHECGLVRNGRIGEVKTFRCYLGVRPKEAQPWQPEPVPKGFDYDLWLGPAPMKPYTTNRCHYNFRFIRDYTGGEITNIGSHYLDLAQWGLGMDESGPVEVEGTGEKFSTGLYDSYHHQRVEYTYANGVKIICKNQRDDELPMSFVNPYIYDKNLGWAFDGTIPWEKADCSPVGPNGIQLYDTHGKEHFGNWVDCILSRQEPSAPAEVGHRTATVCHIGNIATDLGRKLKWDPVKEEFIGDPEANKLRGRDYRKPWTLG